MEENAREKRKKKKKTWILILIAAVLFLLIAAVASAWLVYSYYFSRTNYVPDPDVIDLSSDILESLDGEGTIDPEEEARIRAELESLASAEAEMKRLQEEAARFREEDPNVVHLMLVGVDRRNASWNGNSDTMVLCTVNRSKKTITLTSFMRDTAANIPGIGVRKLNHAFAVGGGPLLVQTIQSNFQIPLSNYAWIDFHGMEDVVDIVGGIDLYLTVAEAKYVGITIETPEVVHLSGKQAVKHARDRSSGGSDYMRTQRQRNVLLAIANKAKSGSLGDLAKVADQILPYITHNIDQIKLLSLITDFLSISDYTLQEQRIPYDGLYRSSNELLIPNYEETARRFREFVY